MAKKNDIQPLKAAQLAAILRNKIEKQDTEDIEALLLDYYEEKEDIEAETDTDEDRELKGAASAALGMFGAGTITAAINIIFSYRPALRPAVDAARKAQQAYELFTKNLLAVRGLVASYNEIHKLLPQITIEAVRTVVVENQKATKDLLATVTAGLYCVADFKGILAVNETQINEKLQKLAEDYNSRAADVMQITNTMQLIAAKLFAGELLEKSKDMQQALELLDLSNMKTKDTAGLLVDAKQIHTELTAAEEEASQYAANFKSYYAHLLEDQNRENTERIERLKKEGKL